jgi:hypothetical protein
MGTMERRKYWARLKSRKALSLQIKARLICFDWRLGIPFLHLSFDYTLIKADHTFCELLYNHCNTYKVILSELFEVIYW